MTSRSRIASVPAALAGLLVLWRVVASSLRALTGPWDGVVTVATVVLLLAALTFVAAVTWFCLEPTVAVRRVLGRAWAGFVVVMTAFLALGVALGRHVPWTACAVLLGVVVLGLGALALARSDRSR